MSIVQAAKTCGTDHVRMHGHFSRYPCRLIGWSSRSRDIGNEQEDGMDGSCSSPEPGGN
jgi:hypothetical protein